MSIPSEILNKPGRLTNAEYEIMNQHLMIGFEMVSDINIYKDEKLLKYIKEITRNHHERYDGRVYPDKLVCEDIPISAQVVSLADVYDALVSPRCYKQAFTPSVAHSMICNGECGIFNPILIEILNENKEEFENVLKSDSSIEELSQIQSSIDNLLENNDIFDNKN